MFVTLKKIIIFFATITIDYITFKYNSYVTNTNYKLQIPGTRKASSCWISINFRSLDLDKLPIPGSPLTSDPWIVISFRSLDIDEL